MIDYSVFNDGGINDGKIHQYQNKLIDVRALDESGFARLMNVYFTRKLIGIIESSSHKMSGEDIVLTVEEICHDIYFRENYKDMQTSPYENVVNKGNLLVEDISCELLKYGIIDITQEAIQEIVREFIISYRLGL